MRDEHNPGPNHAELIDQIQSMQTDLDSLRAAIVDARTRLAKGRALWNGPCHECDAVLSNALSPTTGPRANLLTPWAAPK